MKTALKPPYDQSVDQQPLQARAIIRTLGKCDFVLNFLKQDIYTLRSPYKTNSDEEMSSLGEHMRHVLEYISIALKGNESGVIDYDSRERDHDIQTDLEHAKAVMSDLKRQASVITHADLSKPIDHFEMVDPNEKDEEPTPSSFKRELSHVTHHADHHLYIMRLQCDALGIKMPVDLGVAAATLQHEKNNPS